MQQTGNSPPYNFTLPTPQTANPDTGEASSAFNYDALIAALSSPKGSSTSTATSGTGNPNAAITNVYAYIPSGLVSVQSPATRTKLQQSLYSYGNEVGSSIQSFEQQFPNESQVLMDQAQDRTDAGKAASVQTIAHALSALGDSLLAMESVPSQMTAAHQLGATRPSARSSRSCRARIATPRSLPPCKRITPPQTCSCKIT